MKKSDIKKIVADAMNPVSFCKVLFKYDVNYRYCFPLAVSDKFFLSAVEDEFLINGYTIRRFCDTKDVHIVEGKFQEMFVAEGVIGSLDTPCIDITDWYSVFISLKKMNKNIIVEKEDKDEDDWLFAIGEIAKVTKTKVYMKHFDADGIWQDELWGIPYTQITSVSFGSRYVEVFSKYV